MPERKEEKNEHHNHENHIIEWEAPGRPFKKRTRQYYATTLLIMLLVEIIAFLFSQYLLMVVILALVFIAFALASVPPRDFHYRLSDQGIMIEDRFFLWKELYDFYFVEKDGEKTLHVRTDAYIPGELIITLGNISEEKVKEYLVQFLSFREYIKPTFMDSAASWLARNFPLENQ
jgi:hypothetical protein